jgi:hypothetical protein
VEVANLHDRATAGQVDADVIVRDDAGPEQSILRNTGVEVVDLRRRIPLTGVVNVDSGECERRVPDVTVAALEPPLHEPHVVEDIRQRARLTGLSIRPIDETADESDADGTLEVEHARRIGIDPRKRRRLDVEFLSGDWERRGNRRDESNARGRTLGTRGGRAEGGGERRQAGSSLHELAA